MQRLLGIGLVVVGFVAGLLAVRAPRAEVERPTIRLGVVDLRQEASAPDGAEQAAIELGVVESELLQALRTPAPTRVYEPSAQAAAALARGRETVHARGAPVDNPCRDRGAFPCVERPLDAFFARLDALGDGSAERSAVVLAMGNSLIAADHIVDVVRSRLQARFGDGGRGLLLAERISELGLRRRTGTGSGFTPHYLSQGPRGSAPFGLTGVGHVATDDGARTRIRLAGERRASVWLYVDDDLARVHEHIELSVDGEAVALGAARPGGIVDVSLPAGGERLELRAKRRGVVVQGVVLQHDEPGVVLDTVGLPAADSPAWLSADEELVHAQLRARDPALLMVMLGGVENRRIAWGRYQEEDIERDLRALLARLKAGAPLASCMVVGPIDAVEGLLDERVLGRAVTPFHQRPQLTRVIALERRVALESGCAFFDLFEAMGGRGALRRFAQRGMLHDDHVHPRGFGLDLLGELIADGLLREWQRTARDVSRLRVARALERGRASSDPALERTASLLASVVRGDVRRVSFGVVGADGDFAPRLGRALAASVGPTRLGLDERGRLRTLGVVVEKARPGQSYDVLLVTDGDPALAPAGPLVVRVGPLSPGAGEAFAAALLQLL